MLRQILRDALDRRQQQPRLFLDVMRKRVQEALFRFRTEAAQAMNLARLRRLTRFGPSGPRVSRSSRPSGTRRSVSSSSVRRPVSTISAILLARSLPMPCSSESSLPAAINADTSCGRSPTMRAASR
jgi:hypothetical protein